MKLKYTKTQILEAVRKWERVLQSLDEDSLDDMLDQDTKSKLDSLQKSTLSDDKLENTKKNIQKNAQKSSGEKRVISSQEKKFTINYTFWKLVKSSEDIQAKSEDEAKTKFLNQHQNQNSSQRDFKISSVEQKDEEGNIVE